MSKLSELLNPVSNAIVQESSVESQSPGPDAQDDHPSDQQSKILVQDPLDNHTQHPHMESPLQALANAATSTAPLMSPTHPLGSPLIAGEVSYQSHSSSRPTSSRMSPPLPLELSRQPEHPLAAISPGLEQYHHSPTHKGHARKLSEPDENSGVTLPPLRGSFTKKDLSSKAGRKLVDTNNFGGGEIRIEPERLSPEEQSVKPKKEPGEALSSYKPFQEPSEPFHSTQPIDSSQSLQTTEPPQSLVALESNGLMLDNIKVKAEAMDNSSEYLQNDPEACEQEESLDQSSLKPSVATTDIARPRNVTNLKNDESYQPSLTGTEASIQNASAKSKPAASRKRAAPKSKVGKKGTASAVKPAAKRRKVDSESATATPSAQRSGTPASTRASKTPAPRNRKQESVTPAPSSSVAIHNEDEEDEDDDEDNELFCICRKPDDHTWMIACDGPCQDWFHGRCVGMNEKDGNLIDKYICKYKSLNSYR